MLLYHFMVLNGCPVDIQQMASTDSMVRTPSTTKARPTQIVCFTQTVTLKNNVVFSTYTYTQKDILVITSYEQPIIRDAQIC